MGALKVMEPFSLPLQIPHSSPSFQWHACEVTTPHQQSSSKYNHPISNSKILPKDNQALSNGHGEIEPVNSRKRPTMLVVPEYCPTNNGFAIDEKLNVENIEFQIQGRDHCLVSKKGRRLNMEDRYKVITDISGDPHQAFFAVIDGHGGHAAAEYVAENLGKNILNGLDNAHQDEMEIEKAIQGGYFQTDREFLSQGLSSGACTASVLLRNRELYTANVGDCRVVMSRRGLATRLTNDHRLSREDERSRIENSGGFIHDINGVLRVQGSLSVSRAIGDLHLKDWIISEPEIHKFYLTSDCEFLILASDGLWDKVTEQEAVDIVSREKVMMESCRKLIDISCCRGNRDDITVIVINLQKFVANS